MKTWQTCVYKKKFLIFKQRFFFSLYRYFASWGSKCWRIVWVFFFLRRLWFICMSHGSAVRTEEHYTACCIPEPQPARISARLLQPLLLGHNPQNMQISSTVQSRMLFGCADVVRPLFGQQVVNEILRWVTECQETLVKENPHEWRNVKKADPTNSTKFSVTLKFQVTEMRSLCLSRVWTVLGRGRMGETRLMSLRLVVSCWPNSISFCCDEQLLVDSTSSAANWFHLASFVTSVLCSGTNLE